MLDFPTVRPLTADNAATEEQQFIEEVLKDFWVCLVSREASMLARKEVLTGKAKFGIVGDGKEVPQVALARAFRKGDFRSGYYRDQTIMFALGLSTVEDFFAQLYADAENDPFSGGRQMNSHYATQLVDAEGNWTDHKNLYNISSDISCTAGQMARALGIAFASKKYREVPALRSGTSFSENGNEVCFCTIGDASTSEGIFWESLNAAGVLRVPLAVSVWDDGYGISVPTRFQTTKGSISEVMEGFKLDEDGRGMDIYVCNGWDYPALCDLYETGIDKIRKTHIPAIFHIKELTQPQGHSTSGSHERYKSKERLDWEKEHDCINVMARWIVKSGFITQQEVEELQTKARAQVREARNRAWNAYIDPVRQDVKFLLSLYDEILAASPSVDAIRSISDELRSAVEPVFSEVAKNARRMLFLAESIKIPAVDSLAQWVENTKSIARGRYETHLYSHSPKSALSIPVVAPVYSDQSPIKNGFEVINTFFDKMFEKHPHLFAFGEDVGQIGDVNQGFAGLQAKYGEERIFDTGIREWSIMGQAIGMAMRGLRPIAEIQYLDYLLYGLEPLSDDLATLRYRSNGIQQAPAIIRTRGHRLEGIWHAGSPMGMLIHALRGMYLLVPRNFVQAAGMYNTLLQSDDPAVVVECLNGYRLKEKQPDNIAEYTVPLGAPEVLLEGTDVTLVTYGSCIRIAQEGIRLLQQQGITVELIDAQTLLPFDLEHIIVESLKKTNRIVFMDEDVPGGATSYMMQQVLEVQHGYRYLDAAPITLSAKAHRSPYGSDGDYFSKPNAEDVYDVIMQLVKE